jgi:hypothetical protein
MYTISPDDITVLIGRSQKLGVFTGGRKLKEEGRYQGETEGILTRDGQL